VAKYDKLLDRILRGTSDANIAFEDVRHLLKRLGFAEHIRGDHYIFSKEGVEEILNLQPKGAPSQALSSETGARSHREVSVGRRQR
jgi:virulence-associated protein VapD